MREIERYATQNLGIPGTTLMANAAQLLCAAATEHLPAGTGVAVFAGPGNNGGDGIGAAALLIEKAVPVRVFLIGDEKKLTPDSVEMLGRLRSRGGELESFTYVYDIERYLKSSGVIIDAMFGIGLNAQLRGDALTAVKMINASSAYVIAADIPTGVDADTGAILGDAVNADLTVTFTMPKQGQFIEPGNIRCGELRVRSVGIPEELTDSVETGVYSVEPENIRLPKRRHDSHKGDYGRCLIAAGSVGYTGAPALSARAATKSGAGLVYLGVPESVYNIMAVKCDEEMPFPLPCDKNGRLAANAASELLHRAAQCEAFLIGPGLGKSPEIAELVSSIIGIIKTPTIIDADGLNAIAGSRGVLESASCPLILTPHPGEFARLAQALAPGGRLTAARSFAKANNCVLVLKGHRTITALPDGSAYINTTGGPAMAKGGSGDALAGMIASFICQKFTLKDAAITAVYLHGLAGDLCAGEIGEYSVTASDIIAMIPKAIRETQSLSGCSPSG
ncbi:MAG: NAD(P)H-hydrate dehydratase [Oscillospiraceae bacterium]|nr:NAD(P)H-hydrate dehydratase [Oscillospiraceae bacterium]